MEARQLKGMRRRRAGLRPLLRGVVFMDGVAAPPLKLRLEKPGLIGQTVTVVPAAAGVTARVYVILHHISQAECTCEPAALISGREPCPDEVCGRSRFDSTIPENTPAPEKAPEGNQEEK